MIDKKLSMSGLLKSLSQYFGSLSEKGKGKHEISLMDCLLSGLAIFSLKYPSLLQFDKSRQNPAMASNMKRLFGIKNIPSDTYLRERLDELPASQLRGGFKHLFKEAQRGKLLEQFSWYEGYYLCSIDGTGYFSSHKVHCEHCCKKQHRNGDITYYHQMLSAALVHPEHSHVLPLAPEPIMQQDGNTKNDCERNASKRLLEQLRKDHPHLKLIIVEDGLASNAPHIRVLQSLNMRYILGAKPGDHAYLFNWMDTSPATQSHQIVDQDGTVHNFRYHNQVPLNDSNYDLQVNCLIYEEISPKGKKQRFSWVTDIDLSEQTLMTVMRGGRARWRIENETFNTLKNQGYHFEHNFGHGHQHLSSVFAHLMLLAFLIDQIQGLSCKLFQKAVEAMKSRVMFWERFRAYLFSFHIPDWNTLYHAIIDPPLIELPCNDSS